MIVLPLVATSGVTDCEWDREEWESTGECILTYVSSSHYIKHRNMILWNEIEENENRQQWCIQVWNQKKKKKKHTHLSQKVVLPLLATTSGAADREWEREEWETTSANIEQLRLIYSIK